MLNEDAQPPFNMYVITHSDELYRGTHEHRQDKGISLLASLATYVYVDK